MLEKNGKVITNIVRGNKVIKTIADSQNRVIHKDCTVTTDSNAAYSKSIPNASLNIAKLTTIGGKSVVWNQLFIKTAISVEKGITITPDPNTGILTLSGTSTGTGNIAGTLVANVQGHKYYINGNISDYTKILFTSQSFGADTGNGAIITNTSENTGWYYTLNVRHADEDMTGITANPKIYDLTQMYGAGNEPTTTSDPRIAEIEAYVNLHPEYNSGEIVSAKVDKVVSTSASDVVIADYPIPSEVQALDGYGESNGTKVNYIDYSAKKFIAYGHYVDGTWVDYTEPIQTDISAYLTDNAINVEGGGKLTFHQNGTEFVVPNSEKFFVAT